MPVSTPIGSIIAMTLSCFVGSLLLLNTLYYIRRLHWVRVAFRFVVSAYLLYFVGVRVFLYTPGVDVSPVWFYTGLDLFDIVMCALIIYVTLTFPDNIGKRRRD